MPTINKQIAKPKPKTLVKPMKGGSILSRIRRVETADSGLKMCVYGRSKTGKTRLACTFPKPCLVIGTEDGTKSVIGFKDVDFVPLQKSEELEELTQLLTDGKYKTAVLDTAGGLQDLILKEVLDLDEIPVQRTWGMGSGKYGDGRQMWGDVGLQWKERMRSVLTLSDTISLNVVVIAHERNFNEEGRDNDLIMPTVGAALTPSAAGWLNGACDYICQTFIREHEERVNIGKKDKPIWKVNKGKAEYCLRVGPHPVYQTGFRLPPGFTLPDVITDPAFEKIHKIINGKA